MSAVDLSGDSDRPIGVFPAFGAHAKDVDYFTLMSTYSYYDIKRPGHSDYNDYLMVLDALKGGIPAAKIGCVRAARPFVCRAAVSVLAESACAKTGYRVRLEELQQVQMERLDLLALRGVGWDARPWGGGRLAERH